MVTRFYIACVFLLFSTANVAFDKLTASVDRNPVLVGEYFTLTISADGRVSGQQPDTSALAKQFVMGPVNTGSSTRIINGQASSETTWQMQLMSRRAGDITIPAFTVSGKSSDPIKLKVVARSNDADEQKDIFIKTELKPSKLFVQQAGLYTVKLYLGKDLLDGQLSAPAMENAQVTLLGKQKEDYEVLDGRRYMVISREYLLQPQKSGEYTIDPPIFNGQVRENYRRMSVSAMGKAEIIDVQPVPENYNGAWLPSELVNLSEEFQPISDKVVVGTPITRTITLTALGVTKEQLPEIRLPEVDGFRSYPDESERNQLARDGRVISQLVSSYALVPQIPGTYTLPEVKMPWFNTVINRVQYATLPARTLTVIADPNQTVPAIPNMTAPIQNQQTIEPTIVEVPVEKTLLDWGILVSGYVLWLFTLIFVWLGYIGRKKAVIETETNDSFKPKMSLSLLTQAAKANEKTRFYQLLSEFVTTELTTTSFSQWQKDLDNSELKAEIVNLQAALYSKGTASANLEKIAKLISQIEKNQADQKRSSLQPLY